jgi:biopolymer transport protein ExbD
MAMPVLLDVETQQPDRDEYDDPIRDIDFDEYDPQDEDEAAAEFTLSRNRAETVEELDLAAMVDVAFQLVLFFLVTAQVVLFKTLEVPKPNEDKPPDAAVQARAKSIDDLEKDYILVEVDAAGTIKIDRQPVAASRPVLVEKLRKTRQDTQRKAMLLSADFATRHENAVLIFDVANEIDLKIAIAQPAAKK